MKRAIVFLLVVFFTLPAFAQDQAPQEEYVTGLSEVNSGAMIFYLSELQKYRKAPELKMDVRISVDGMIVRGAFTQEFQNPMDQWLEGTYAFPLPETAAVCRFRMIIGDRVIDGTIKEKAEAKKVYETAKAEGKKAALLEQDRPNIFSVSVANIPPREKITVELEYQQALEPQDGNYELRFPLVINPRYDPSLKDMPVVLTGEGAVPNVQAPDDHIPRFFLKPAAGGGSGKRNPVDITVDVSAGFPIRAIASLYHAANVEMKGADACTLKLASGPVPADRDFVLAWKPEVEQKPAASAFMEKGGTDTYALLMIQPPSLASDNVRPIPRETVYIIDRSGSMGGSSIEQAKASLQTALKLMSEQDSFNIIEYDDQFSALYTECRPMSRKNLSEAVRFVDALDADGGTEMKQALEYALNLKRDPSRLGQVIFITDGSVTNEAELFALIKSKLGDRRLFTVGIGSAPNSYFMRKAAASGRGTFTYVGGTDEVESAMKGLFEKIMSPVMRNIEVAFQGTSGEIWPQPVPDLYTGEPVIILARLADERGKLTVRGEYGGKPWAGELELQKAVQAEGVGTLWARKKIDAFMDLSAEGVPDQEIRSKVLPLALEFGIVSKYTSFVAVEHVVSKPATEKLESGNVPPNNPAGWQPPAAMPKLAATATPGTMLIISGGILLAIGLIAFRMARTNAGRSGKK